MDGEVVAHGHPIAPDHEPIEMAAQARQVGAVDADDGRHACR